MHERRRKVDHDGSHVGHAGGWSLVRRDSVSGRCPYRSNTPSGGRCRRLRLGLGPRRSSDSSAAPRWPERRSPCRGRLRARSERLCADWSTPERANNRADVPMGEGRGNRRGRQQGCRNFQHCCHSPTGGPRVEGDRTNRRGSDARRRWTPLGVSASRPARLRARFPRR